ncbi:hypothetical protein E2C01_086792 [Portunus trituberculatus]|uniref:Uncharacterized protein n=1 Tax=Portunus trituberculatus TaxID=210409 RepID=A0A5B7JCD9_PORTR|nr:hypothetical protein [Portunus trituberculatus]
MAPQTSRVMDEEEDTRGGGCCFGWLRKLFRRKKRERRAKRKEAEPSLTPDSDDVPSIYFQNNRVTEISEGNVIDDENGLAEACSAAAAAEDVGEERQKDEVKQPKVAVTWAEEVDEAEEKGLDVFAPEISCLPHTASVNCETSPSPENETAAATTKSKKRRVRRRALHAALKASAESEAAANSESRASAENEAESTTNSEERLARDARVSGSDEPPFVAEAAAAEAAHSGTSATRRRRARRRAVASRIRSEARLAATTGHPSVWPSPSVRVYGREGRPFVTTWEEAAYGAFHAQRHG